MPYKIIGQVLDSEGFPLNQIAAVKEIPPAGSTVTYGEVWTDPDTGNFELSAIYNASTIQIFAVGYLPKTFPAQSVPAIIKLESALVIEGKTTPKKDNTLLYVGLAALALIGISSLTGSASKPVKQMGITGRKKAPARKTPIRPKQVTV